MSLFEWLSCSRATQTPWQISLRSCRRRDTRRRVTMDAPGEIRPPFFVCINRVEKDTKTLLVIIPTHDVILHPIEKRESKERKKSLLQSAFVVVVHYVVVPNRNARRVNIIFQGRTRRASLPRTTTTTKTKRRPRRKMYLRASYVCGVGVRK